MMNQHNVKLPIDEEILSIDVIDNNEPLIDLKQLGGIVFGESPEIPNNTNYTKLRKSVYEKLMQAQAMLPKGLYFCLYEGYRGLELQDMLFKNRYQQLKNIHQHWQHEQLFIESTRLVSPVVNLDGSKNIPPHSTGGAIDIYLIDADGQPVDMGIHPKDWMLDHDGSISLTNSIIISDVATKNRAIMTEVLSAVGFRNYPAEYWHWSYGDRLWAYYDGKRTAIYNSI